MLKILNKFSLNLILREKQIKNINANDNDFHEVLKIIEKPNLLAIQEKESFNPSFFKIVSFWFRH